MAASLSIERRRDEIPHAATYVSVLGWEQSVIALQTHGAANLDCLVQNAGRQLAGLGCCDGSGEKDPDVSPPA